MKRHRKPRAPWYVPPPPPVVATFACRACGAAITGPLRRLDDPGVLVHKELEPLVPAGAYWPVTAGHLPSYHVPLGASESVAVDFTGCYAVRPDALVGVGNHPDGRRWIGCCGPSGTDGPNRVCGCGRTVGTERSGCMWPVAVYLDPAAVRPEESEVATPLVWVGGAQVSPPLSSASAPCLKGRFRQPSPKGWVRGGRSPGPEGAVPRRDRLLRDHAARSGTTPSGSRAVGSSPTQPFGLG